MTKKTIFIIVAIVVIVGGFFGFWYYRSQIFSNEVLKLEILGPDSAKVGDQIQYTVKYKNNGNFVLENPKLIFELPENSLTEDSKTRITKDIKDIYPGDSDLVQFDARLLGKENDVKKARVSLSYTPKNLSVRYERNTTLATKIETVPITLDFDVPSKVEKGKSITVTVNYFSNIDYPLENLSIKVDPVAGFTVTSANPTSLDNIEWRLPTLQKAQGGRITLTGTANADTDSPLNFSAHLGMWIDGTFVVIKDSGQDVQTVKPLVFISQEVNGSPNYVALPGQTLHYKIFLRNIGTSPLKNVFVNSDINGSAFDLSTLSSSLGQVRTADGVVAWDGKQIPDLQIIDAGQEVSVAFDVKLKSDWIPSDAEKNNTVLKNTVMVSGIAQEFTVKVGSTVAVSQKAYHQSQGGFDNSGPIPPEVDRATTYVIAWQVKNYLNDVKNVKVRATLAKNVTLTAVLPESQLSHFSLDSASHQIVWSVGDLKAGAGITSAPPVIYFQVTLIPDESMQGSVASLIGKATITGEDQSTGLTVTNTDAAKDTSLPDDQDNSGGGFVR